MKIWKKPVFFVLGGGSYVALELLWRGRSHVSMFAAGGTCFLLLGGIAKRKPRLPLIVRGLAGAGVVTMVELLAGLIINRDHHVWDYRNMPMQFRGQICLPFSLLWVPLSLGAMRAYTFLDQKIQKR